MKTKMKTHSGAKKRLRVTAKGKVKRGKVGMRHLLSKHSSKNKRQLGKTAYVHDTIMDHARKLLLF